MGLLTLSLLIGSALAGDVQVELSWRKNTATVAVLPPDGEHIAPDAPAAGWMEIGGDRFAFETDGTGLSKGLLFSLAGQPVQTLEGAISLAVCTDDGSTCRPVQTSFVGLTSGTRGRMILDETNSDAPQETDNVHLADPAAAFTKAKAKGKRVLLEFSTVWCPPCQLLGAEILRDPANRLDLEPFVVVQLDADSPASFVWKDRYAIAGYPTVIITDAEGELISRMVGYDGEDAYLKWLAESATTSASVATLLSDLDAVPEDQLTAVARRLIAEGQEEAAENLIQRIPDPADRVLLTFKLHPTEALLSVVAKDHPDQIMDWIWEVVYELFQTEDISAESKALVRAVATRALQDVEVEQAAELAYVLADLTPEDEHPEQIFALGAAMYRSAMTGEPALDRGRYSFLATLLERAEDPAGAIAVMDTAIAAFPEEFTYHFKRAALLKDDGQLEAALQAAKQAALFSHGDTAIRAGQQIAEILVELGRKNEAKEVLAQTLADAERPEEGLKVRTWRYIELIESALSELD